MVRLRILKTTLFPGVQFAEHPYPKLGWHAKRFIMLKGVKVLFGKVEDSKPVVTVPEVPSALHEKEMMHVPTPAPLILKCQSEGVGHNASVVMETTLGVGQTQELAIQL
jgi:hypothetical protein